MESSREMKEGKAQKHMVAGPTGGHGNSWRRLHWTDGTVRLYWTGDNLG